MSRAAQRLERVCYRPARSRRRFRHDAPTAIDLFSGFGGLTEGILRAGFLTITAANHNEYKVEVHERNHPYAEHYVANLVDRTASDYQDVRDLPYADLLVAGVSCTNHSQANTKKAYARGLSLFDFQDEEYEERVTKSERDRATASCVLHYAQKHHPRLILVECTTEIYSWGVAVPGRKKVGDGSTYKWWLKEFEKLGYRHKVLYLNSQFFGVTQSRDRWYCVMWDKSIPDPDLEHRPPSWCDPCHKMVEAVWSWKTGIPPTGSVRYGKQYNYRCPHCRREVIPPMAPSIHSLDLTNLGVRIGDKPLKKFVDKETGEITWSPMAPATMARAERCRQRFPQFPAVLMPAKSVHGTEKHPWQPMSTQTSQQETSLLSTGALMVAAGNTFERPGSECRSRDLGQPLWSQTATNTVGLMTPPVAVTGMVTVGHRHNGDGQHLALPMDTITSTQEKAVLVAAVDNFQGAARGVGEPLATQGGSETMALLSTGIVPFRKNTLPTTHGQPMPAVTAEQIPGLLSVAGFYKQNGSSAEATAPHPLSDPLGTLTSRDTTAMLMAQWRDVLEEIPLEDCFFRMLKAFEIGRACGFDPEFAGHKGTFEVWGSERDQVDGYGNAVSPAVGQWIGERLYAALHRPEAVV